MGVKIPGSSKLVQTFCLAARRYRSCAVADRATLAATWRSSRTLSGQDTQAGERALFRSTELHERVIAAELSVLVVIDHIERCAPRRHVNREEAAMNGPGDMTLLSSTDRQQLSEMFLRRLRRALLLRFYAGSLLSPGDRRLLDWVIYSTFCDCQALDDTAEARRLLNEARAGAGLFARPLSRRGGIREWST